MSARMNTIHVLRTPMREHSRKPAGFMWCFGCRARLPHDLVVSVPVDPMSYYGPSPRYECFGCRHDRTCFPGTWHEWEEV